MPRRYTLTPCGTGNLGAVITDLDLSTIVEYDLEYLKHDWLKYKLVIIKGQHDLSTEQFGALQEKWGGELETHEQQMERGARHGQGLEESIGPGPVEGHPAVHQIHHHRNSPPVENYWHMDASYLDNPPFVTCIRMMELPERGSNTLWADTNAIYENMSFVLKEAVHGKTAKHGGRLQRNQDTTDLQSHPIVAVHPETGLYHLNVNPLFTISVDGMEEQKGFMLLRHIFDQNAPEFQYRHLWEEGDVAIWDNRSVWHYAVSDYWPNERKIQRWTSFDTSKSKKLLPATKILDDNDEDVKRRNAKYRGRVQILKNRKGFNSLN